MAAAFASISLSSAAVLDHPAAGAELPLATDTSTTHVGALIQQKRPGEGWQGVGFFYAQLDKAQTNYIGLDHELLTVVAAIKHFRYLLEGRHFVIFTDQKPLVGVLGRCSDPWMARQQHQLSFITEFAPSIRQITEQSNVVADTLFRPAGDFMSLPPPQHYPGNFIAPCSGPSEAGKVLTGVKAPSGSLVPPP
jgi:hypothetical protein